jgi:proline dehydrogenase
MSESEPLSFDNTAIAFASKNDSELRKASWLFRMMSNSAIVDIGSHLTRLALQMGLPVKSLVKQTIYSHFCGGESLQETVPTIDRLACQGVSTILDYGVEAKEGEDAFNAAVEEQLRAIHFADDNAHVPYLSCKITGYASFDLLRKLHREDPLDDQDQAALERLEARLIQICDRAVASDAAIYVDAEESWIQDGIDRLVARLMARYNQDKPVVFNTVQLYRHDRLEFLKNRHREAEAEGYILGLKLVRGAYMEKERDRAERKGYPSPIHADKEAVDADFDEALVYCLEHIDRIAFCAATHNEDSCMLLVRTAIAQEVDLRHPHIHFAQLYGMSDHISFNLAQAGFNASKYVPYGPVRDVVPYLIRRARENRSVAGQISRELRLILDEGQRRSDARQISAE